MESSNVIFGSDLQLPSIEGIKSTCEDELYLLMKEVDLAFERKYKGLLTEVSKLKVSCQEKTNNYKSTVDHLSKEFDKLKEENSKLKNENYSLRRRAQRISESEKQNENLLRSLAIQQEENVILKDRMGKLSEKHSVLQENYQKLLNIMTSDQKPVGKGDEKNHQKSSLPNFIVDFVAQETENYLKEEMEHCNELQTKIYDEIDEFQRTLKDETV